MDGSIDEIRTRLESLAEQAREISATVMGEGDISALAAAGAEEPIAR
ncbi:MAG TPA: hypothetical protein VGC14_26740 [Rhizobium sp.]